MSTRHSGTRDPGVAILVIVAGILIAFLAVLSFYLVVSSDDTLDCRAENVERTQDGLRPLYCDD